MSKNGQNCHYNGVFGNIYPKNIIGGWNDTGGSCKAQGNAKLLSGPNYIIGVWLKMLVMGQN